MSIKATVNGTEYSGITTINAGGKAVSLAEVGTMVTPTATKSITANGTNIDVLNYAKVNVEVESGSTPTYQEKTVTTNGIVTPDSGYDALSKVVVNVPQSGASDNSLSVEYVLAEDFTSTTATNIAVLSSDSITAFLNTYIGGVSNQGNIKTVFTQSMVYDGNGTDDVYFLSSSFGSVYGREGTASIKGSAGYFAALKSDGTVTTNSANFTMMLTPTYENKLNLSCRCNSGTTAIFPAGTYKFKITPIHTRSDA